jgi:pimeloyl-ACP methyl ester carboxylesterase
MVYQFADINGAKLHYEVRGAGRPLVLIHAGIAHLEMWDGQMDAFAGPYQVIRYDMRGEGRSSSPPGLYGDHEDLAGLLAYLGVERATLVGVSKGGGAAINFALAYPARVQALVLVASGLAGYEYQFVDEKTEQEDAAIEAAIERGDVALAAELETRMWVVGPNRTSDQVHPAVWAKALAMNTHNFNRPAAQGQQHKPEVPAINRLEEINLPVLVIVGDQDLPDMLAIADILASRISGAKKVVIPDTAHLPNLEKPELFNQVVLEFLENCNYQ